MFNTVVRNEFACHGDSGGGGDSGGRADVDIVSCCEGQEGSQPWRGVKVLIRPLLPSNSPA